MCVCCKEVPVCRRWTYWPRDHCVTGHRRGHQGFDALIFCIQGRVEAGDQAQSPHPKQGPVGGRGLGLFEERSLDSHSESREKGRCKIPPFGRRLCEVVTWFVRKSRGQWVVICRFLYYLQVRWRLEWQTPLASIHVEYEDDQHVRSIRYDQRDCQGSWGQ